jgi:penicillin-binding protein-related factor A (putative recombinase)
MAIMTKDLPEGLRRRIAGTQASGKKSSPRGNRGKPFEELLERTFDPMIYSDGVSFLAKMPVPTAPTKHAGRHLRVLKGKAPYDFYGMMRGGKFIGMEAKHNDEHHTSLRIVGPTQQGEGLKFHQLEAVAKVAMDGGIARIVWENGGVITHLCNQGILAVHESYNNGGRKSIPADLFEICDHKTSQGIPYVDWLCAEKE